MPSTQRLHGLDFLRALMMSLGTVLHTAQLYLVNPILDYYWDPARSLSMDVLLFWINTYRMPVFFLLSGFFTALLLQRRGPQAMLKNRYQRIVVPFLLFLPPLALVMTALRIVSRHVMTTGEWGLDLAYIANSRQLWDNTHNLWFLYYLMLYLVTVWLAVTLRPRLAAARSSRPVQSLPVIVIVGLAFALLGSFNWAGRVSAKLSFVPALDVYLYFGLSFVVGWMLHQRKEDLDVLAAKWARYMAIASVLCLLALGTLLAKGEPADTRYAPMHALLSLLTGFSIAYYMLAFVGLFSRYFSGYNPWMRYFSDSAYWIFIFHSIPMIIIALLLHGWNVAAEWKFLMVCTGTTAMCLLSYQFFVRDTRIGEILNGQRFTTVPWR